MGHSYPNRSFLIRLNKMRAACASAGAFTSRFEAIAEASDIRSSRRLRYPPSRVCAGVPIETFCHRE